MPTSAQLLPYREFSDEKPCGWFAGENPTTLRFLYTGTDWTVFFQSANANSITLFDSSAIQISVGDSLRLTYSDRVVIISINRITTVGSPFTYQCFFTPSVAYSPLSIISVERWIGRNDYIEIEFRSTLLAHAFYVERIKYNQLGFADLDLSAALRAFNSPNFVYDFAGHINQLQIGSQTNFVIVWSAYELGLPYSGLLDYKLHSVRGAQQILNPNSNNLIEYTPNPGNATVAKWLTKFPRKKVWAGYPTFISFIYSEFIADPTLNFGMTSIPLDNTQGIGINHINISDYLAGEPCFTIGADPVPDPPPPNPLPARRRLINWHFRNSQYKAKLSVAETIQWAASYQFEGLFNSGGVKFKINAIEFVSLAAFQLALLTTSGGEDVEIEIINQSAVNSYFTDEVFQIEYGTNDTTVYPFFRQHVIEFSDSKVGCDRMIMNTHRLELNPLTAAHSPMRLGIRTLPTTLSDYNSFPYSLASATDIANANVALAAIHDGTPYALHFNFGWNGNFPAGTALTTGNQDGSFQYRFLDAPYNDNYFIHRSAGEDSFPLNYPTLNSSKRFDGATTYTRITNALTSAFDNKPFTVYIKFFVNNLGTIQSFISTRANNPANATRGFEIRNSGGGVAWFVFVVGINQGFYFPFPIKKGWNTVTAYHNGTQSATIVSNGVRYTPAPVAFGGYILGTAWSIENTSATHINKIAIGSAYAEVISILHNGHIEGVDIWAGEFVPIPDNMEFRCLQTVQKNNGGAWSGETYNPIGSSQFWLKGDYSTGVPLVTASTAITRLELGLQQFNNYLTL